MGIFRLIARSINAAFAMLSARVEVWNVDDAETGFVWAM